MPTKPLCQDLTVLSGNSGSVNVLRKPRKNELNGSEPSVSVLSVNGRSASGQSGKELSARGRKEMARRQMPKSGHGINFQ